MRFTLISFSLILWISSSNAQDLDAILEAHFKAAEQEQMEKVETMITTGRNSYSNSGIESSFKKYQSRPDRLRIQSSYMGSDVIQTYNGQTGWMYAPGAGITEPAEITGVELETMLNQAVFENPLWGYSEKGNRIELVETPENGPAHHLKLITAAGKERHVFIDRINYLITSIRSTQVMGGSETEVEINLGEYRRINGIPVAHQIITLMNGEVMTTIEIERVEFNRRIDPALFEKPAVQ